jgi:hypothetical protein
VRPPAWVRVASSLHFLDGAFQFLQRLAIDIGPAFVRGALVLLGKERLFVTIPQLSRGK